MSNPIEIDVVTQPVQATDLALENLLGELDDDPTRTAEGRTRSENGRGDVSPSPDSFQVIQDRELLSIMEDISEATARGPDRGTSVVAESRSVVSVSCGRQSASDSAGRTGGIENRTAVGRITPDRNSDEKNRTAVGHDLHDGLVNDENRTAVGVEVHGRSETAGTNARLGTRIVVGHEVPVPADDGWSEEESRRLIENPREDSRIPNSGEERDRKASQVLENHGVLTDADLIGMREPPGLGLGSQVRSSEGMSTEVMSRGMISPMDIRGILNAIPDFTGMPNPVPQKLPDIHSLFDGIASGRERGERRREDREGHGTNPRTETPTSRQRAQSEVRRSPETIGGTPNKRIRSSSAVSSVSPGAEARLHQVSALLGSPEGGRESGEPEWPLRTFKWARTRLGVDHPWTEISRRSRSVRRRLRVETYAL